MRHELSAKEIMFLHDHPALRLCSWCLRKLAEAKYSRLLSSQVRVGGKFIEESGACSECRQHMNLFVSACPFCGLAAPQPHQKCYRAALGRCMSHAAVMAAATRAAEIERAGIDPEEDEEDPEPPPVRVVRGGLPSLGKRR